MTSSVHRSGIVPYLFYEDAEAAMAWYGRVFGWEEVGVWRDDDGKVQNGEMKVGDTELWLDGGGPAYWEKNGRGPSPWIGVWVDDVDEMTERIRAAGIEVDDPVTREFGIRMSAEVEDLAGYRWSFMQRLDNS
jgi:uncharacterized glyoxalase superfamily protein PhnB